MLLLKELQPHHAGAGAPRRTWVPSCWDPASEALCSPQHLAPALWWWKAARTHGSPPSATAPGLRATTLEPFSARSKLESCAMSSQWLGSRVFLPLHLGMVSARWLGTLNPSPCPCHGDCSGSPCHVRGC